ncbi:MAG: PD40 domain-containing protein [Sedimentisphaerales bacterium]|nr:PD40 domain-containing protein [Sedimentisphaerales bacterium]
MLTNYRAGVNIGHGATMPRHHLHWPDRRHPHLPPGGEAVTTIGCTPDPQGPARNGAPAPSSARATLPTGRLKTILLAAQADFAFGEPTNLGPTVNSSSDDGAPCISPDGLELYFCSNPDISRYMRACFLRGA